MKNKKGFTLIELLVVIAVIGILAGIISVSYVSIQRDSRNSQRASTANSIAEALERYYDSNGEYPGCTNLTADGTTVVADTLTNFNKNLLLTPKHADTATNSIMCTDLTDGSTNDIFAYLGDGSSTCQNGEACLEWTLEYIQEGSSEIQSISSRRTAELATSGSVNLIATAPSATTTNLSWNSIPNITSYNVQCSPDQTAWTDCKTLTTTSTSFTGLGQGQRYYYRVQGMNGTNAGAWSNVAFATTPITQPAAYSVTSSNTSSAWDWLYVTSEAVCPADTAGFYRWYKDGTFWVEGAQHRTVGYQLGWDTSTSITVDTRCTTSLANSSYRRASNSASMSITSPSATLTLPGDGVMYWTTTCPQWTTSRTIYWDTNGRLNTTGSSTSANGNWTPPAGEWWGDGKAELSGYCTGPWGNRTFSVTQVYGPGCLPTITNSMCTWTD